MDVHVQQITDVPGTADLVQQILHVAEVLNLSTVCDAKQNRDCVRDDASTMHHAKYWFFSLSPATAALLCTLVVCCALAWLYGVTDPTPEMTTPDHRVSSGRSEPGSPPPGPTKSSVSFSNDGGGPQGHARALAAEFNQVKRNRNGRPDTSPRRVLPSAVRSAM